MQGQVVLITGGARRVGAAICRHLHACGANLMIHYRSSANEARALQAELNLQRPDSVALIQADLQNLSFAQSTVSETVARFGRLDVLINNASSFLLTEVGEITENNWHELIGVNLAAPLFLSQAAAAELQKNRGSIVNIGDIHAELPMKGYVVYNVAKGGLAALTRSLARELAPDVRVNAIAPGPILWPEDGPQFDKVTRQRIISHTLLKRLGDPSDIAKAVYFLADQAPYVTGQTIVVDGGRSINM
ncbi:MAG: pteridine reductase [Burkholderiales bacterium]